MYINTGLSAAGRSAIPAKQQELITPIQKKAIDATQTVAKENGFT